MTPMRDLLQRFSAELARCRGLVDAVETEVTQMMQDHGRSGASLQAIDLLGQSLDDLSVFALDMAEAQAEGLMCDGADVTARLRLGDIRQRLSAMKLATEGPVERIELF
jgi:hypothetical protein